MRARRFLIATAALTAGLVLAGCGDDDGSSSVTPPGSEADLTVLADDPPDFDGDAYTATAGDVAVEYRNDGSVAHTLVIDGVDGFKLTVASRGDIDTGTVELEAGEYVLYCDISGHRAAGMEATLTVE